MQNYKSMKNAVLKQHLKYDLNQALHVKNIVSFWIEDMWIKKFQDMFQNI